MNEDEKQEFEDEKAKFYEDQEQEARNREINIVERNTGGAMSRVLEKTEAERQSWEKEALKEIDLGLSEERRTLLCDYCNDLRF